MAELKGQVQVKGFARVKIRILDLGEDAFDRIREIVIRGAHNIRNTMIQSMHHTPRTGRVYRRQQGKKIHIASSSPNPPAVDSGELISRITMDARRNEIEVGAESGAPHAKWLEKGTPRMEKRPFLKPALDKHLPGLKEEIRRALLG